MHAGTFFPGNEYRTDPSVDIAWMVSKESGRAGGFLEKYQAAKETGCRMIVIGRPKEEQGMELEKCIEYLNRRFLPKENVANDAKIEIVNTDTENIENPGSGQEKVAQEPVMQEAATQNTEAVTEEEETEDILRGQKVSLVGIGMGTADTLTQEGKQALECADLLIGAARMVEHIRKPGQEVWTGYKPEEICAYIAAHPEHRNVAIALSGDVGFYSGAKKLLETLHRELPMVQKKVYCGISSMIYFCAKLETPWEDVHRSAFMEESAICPDFCVYTERFLLLWERQTASQNCVRSCSATAWVMYG